MAIGRGEMVKVEGGDTLSSIAARRLGDPNRWPELFEANRTLIEREGLQRGMDRLCTRLRRDYRPEDWIFPGMVLALPSDPSGKD
jgi:nucleoid-associated protein YgaU